MDDIFSWTRESSACVEEAGLDVGKVLTIGAIILSK